MGLVRLLSHSLFETYQKDFLFYQQVLAQQPKDKNKIYSLHEPDVYVIAKGKDHKRFLESLKSDLRCLIIGSMAARLLHSLRFLSR
jgi:IS5 family transposase